MNNSKPTLNSKPQDKSITVRYLDPASAKLGEYEPGNGTSYKVLALPIYSRVSLNALGSIGAGWLVVNCNNGHSYLFQSIGYLANTYIQEKLGQYPADYPHFGDLVRHVTNREQ